MRHLLVRVDANEQIGWGHLMRCLAVADAWRDFGGRASFVIRREAASRPAMDRIRAGGHACFPLAGRTAPADEVRFMRSIAKAIDATWLLLDGYHFTTEYQHRASSTGINLAVLDDTGHLPRYCADVLVNPSPAAGRIKYELDRAARQLLGVSFLPLREDVFRRRGPRRTIAAIATRVLVTLGGGDATGYLLKIIEGLSAVGDPDLVVQVAVGPAACHRVAVQEAVARRADPRIQLVDATSDLARRMAEADLAISAAGTTLWELALLGVPTLALAIAENQRPIIDELAERGAVVSLGVAEHVSPDRIASAVSSLRADAVSRRAMSEVGRHVVDGRGAARIVQALLGHELRLRWAEAKDCLLLWHWANDPDTRAASFDSRPIPWEAHRAWFAVQTQAADTLFLVAEDAEGDPIGQVRFVRCDRTALTSISLDQRWRGRGYGWRLIRKAAGTAFERWPSLARLEAEVKTSNLSSLRAFERAGFARHATAAGRGADSIVFQLVRGESV